MIHNSIPDVNALSSTWDFSTPGDYTLSGVNSIRIRWWEADLIQQIEHVSVVNDNVWWALLFRPRRVSVDGDYAYVSAHDDDTIQIIDISDPTAPGLEWSITHDGIDIFIDRPYDTVVNGNYLYVAAFQSDAIQIIDISNPASPVEVGEYINDASVRLNGARWLDIQWDYLYVASYNDDAVQVFDISTPTSLVPTDNIRANGAGGRLNGARDIIVDGNYAYVSARNDSSLQVIDISDPSDINFVAQLENDDTTIFLNSVWGIDKVWDYIYATDYNNDGIQIIDVSIPTAPSAVSFTDNSVLTNLNGPRDVQVDGDYAYIADLIWDSIMSMDISDPLDTFQEFELPNSGTTNLNGPRDIQIVWKYIYVAANTDNDFVILKKEYDTSSPTIIPNTAFNFWLENLTSFTETLWANNAWTVTYQISRNNWTDWYYYNGTTWTLTTGWVAESSSASIINTNISDFNAIWSGTEFLWKAFLTSDGDQKVEIDEIQINSAATNPILSVTKTDNDADNIVNTSEVIRYTITLSNSWANASGISIIDTIDSDFGTPYNFMYASCGTPSDSFVDPILTFSSISVDTGLSCVITYDVQVDSWATGWATITNSADASVAAEGWNNPLAANADALTVRACGINDVNIEFNTDNWWEDTYWSLTPNGNACGSWEIANGWNTTDLTCASGWAQSAGAGNGYADNSTITEWPFSLTVGTQYDLHVIDDWGDGMTWDPDVTIEQNWSTTNTFVVDNTGWVFTFTVQEPTGCADVIDPSLTINQAPSQIDPTSIDSATFRVVFDEPINIATFTVSDITLSGTTWTVTSWPTEVSPNNGTSFEFSVTGMTDWDTVTATIWAWLIQDIAGNTNIASISTDNTITYIGWDTTPPVITSLSIASGSLLPWGNHTLSIEYNDADSGIDTGTAILQLAKWDGISAYGPNIAATGSTSLSTTSTGATYSLDDLDFWKYVYAFQISDNDGNASISTGAVFYIDIPEFTVSTPEVDLWILNVWSETFSPTVTVTVKTLWAGFDVTFDRSSDFTEGTENIIPWNTTSWYGYQQTPYTWTISSINTSQNIVTQAASLNTNGDKNTYTYEIQLGAIIDIQQAAGNYEWNLDFDINLTY